MRKAVTDWCGRHADLALALGIIVCWVCAGALLVAVVAIIPAPKPATAKPVKTPVPTVSCTINHSSDYKDYADECKVTLKDGRTVTCVNIAKGTSCDWAHATTKKGK